MVLLERLFLWSFWGNAKKLYYYMFSLMLNLTIRLNEVVVFFHQGINWQRCMWAYQIDLKFLGVFSGSRVLIPKTPKTALTFFRSTISQNMILQIHLLVSLHQVLEQQQFTHGGLCDLKKNRFYCLCRNSDSSKLAMFFLIILIDFDFQIHTSL